MLTGDRKKRRDSDVILQAGADVDNEEVGEVQWDPELDLEAEKAKAFGVLSKLVPQSEVFF